MRFPFAALLIGAALLVAGPVVADPPGRPPPAHGRVPHARYYPPPGYRVPALPPGHRVAHHHHVPYYYYGGAWYRPYGAYYRVVAPPIGIAVSFLPDFYTTVWYGGAPYYYANSVYYARRAGAPGYVVTAAPAGVVTGGEAAAATMVGDEIYVYPRQGQPDASAARDRYDCHRWAVSQTGFDPSQPGGGVPESRNAAGRGEYRRAITACLEARGYSVR
jgi:hypothetical protein